MHYGTPQCCDPLPHPLRLAIPAGLDGLPRQIATFARWRAALLAGVGGRAALVGWTADAEGDLGVMLLEFWAYVLDVTSFYDARIAERAYLATAHDPATAREIVALLGYVPRPALAAAVDVALEAAGADPVAVPARTGFRSEAFGAEPPQVFETLSDATIWPQRNRWRIGPIRGEMFDGTVRFRPGEGPARGEVIAIGVDGTALFAGRVAAVEAETLVDGERYLRVDFGPEADISKLMKYKLAELRAWTLGFRTGLWGGTAAAGGDAGKYLYLDAYYPQIVAGSIAALEISGTLKPMMVATAEQKMMQGPLVGSTHVEIPVSALTPVDGGASASTSFLYINPRPLGMLTRPAERDLTYAELAGPVALRPPVTQLGAAPGAGGGIALGASVRGASLPGTVEVDAAGKGRFTAQAGATPFQGILTAPIDLYGNVVRAVRGETVPHEILGSGNAAQAFQAFKLAKKPLTWVTDASAASGRSPQLQVMVDGIFWTWVGGFYGQSGDARVFMVEMAEDGAATIRFGDGVAGSRLPTGVNNVLAAYRYGAGAAKPPPGSIKQMARSTPGVTRVLGPLDAFGGGDAETRDETRRSGPASMLSLGRAVSAADYLAMARAYMGVVNAGVVQRWDPAQLAFVIDILTISDGGDVSPDLKDYLATRSSPGVQVNVSAALKVAVPAPGMVVQIQVAPDHVPGPVRDAAAAALFGSEGLLSAARMPIGAPVFRSVVLAALHAVPGVAEVRAIRVGGEPMGMAIKAPAGGYFDFAANGSVI